MKTITKKVKFAQLTLNNNKMETRETSKDKIFKKHQAKTFSIANKYYLREALSHLQTSIAYYIKNDLGIFTYQPDLLWPSGFF